MRVLLLPLLLLPFLLSLEHQLRPSLTCIGAMLLRAMPQPQRGHAVAKSAKHSNSSIWGPTTAAPSGVLLQQKQQQWKLDPVQLLGVSVLTSRCHRVSSISIRPKRTYTPDVELLDFVVLLLHRSLPLLLILLLLSWLLLPQLLLLYCCWCWSTGNCLQVQRRLFVPTYRIL